MRLYSLALLGFCLLSCPAAWAEEPPEDAPADSVDAPAANERPLLPERSIRSPTAHREAETAKAHRG